MARIVGIIPARFESKRLPGKMLLDLAGKPLILHTYERARQAKLLDRVIVATDDQRIADAVAGAGGQAVMTAAGHRSGSDRAAEAVSTLECDIAVNIQGDEALIEPAIIDAAAQLLLDRPEAGMGTMACPIRTQDEYADRNTVKVVFNTDGEALYFSRAPIPHTKRGRFEPGLGAYRHIGIYSFRRDVLLAFTALPPSPLEQAEDLEQLRALENGVRIIVGVAEQHTSLNIDTPDDLERARELLCRSTSS